MLTHVLVSVTPAPAPPLEATQGRDEKRAFPTQLTVAAMKRCSALLLVFGAVSMAMLSPIRAEDLDVSAAAAAATETHSSGLFTHVPRS